MNQSINYNGAAAGFGRVCEICLLMIGSEKDENKEKLGKSIFASTLCFKRFCLKLDLNTIYMVSYKNIWDKKLYAICFQYLQIIALPGLAKKKCWF